jgi:hypothetical protein
MIRKSKEHFGISTKGIKFRERWNIVEMATEQEFKEYIKLEKKVNKIETKDPKTGKWDWNFHSKKENTRVKQRYLRSIWRVRYGNQFKKDQLYRIDKKIHRYNCKISPTGANGIMGLWTLRHGASNVKGLNRGNIVMYSHTDELGMHYFTRIDQIDAAHMYVFKSNDHQLCAIVPLEET